MKKLISFLAVICLVPTLAFAGAQCKKLTDDQYRQAITSQPIVARQTKNGVTVTVAAHFHTNGTMDAHIDVDSYQLGHGEINIKTNWSVADAVLYTHITSATHPRAANPQMNRALDEAVAETLADPDSVDRLDDCNPSNMKASLFLKK